MCAFCDIIEASFHFLFTTEKYGVQYYDYYDGGVVEMNHQRMDMRTDINVFISSTFRDMQYERDVLHNRVFPVLNARALSFGKTVTMTDLRWGVNTDTHDTGRSAARILSVCFNAIDRCRPYMIVIIGNRYGSIMNKRLVQELFPVSTTCFLQARFAEKCKTFL